MEDLWDHLANWVTFSLSLYLILIFLLCSCQKRVSSEFLSVSYHLLRVVWVSFSTYPSENGRNVGSQCSAPCVQVQAGVHNADTECSMLHGFPAVGGVVGRAWPVYHNVSSPAVSSSLREVSMCPINSNNHSSIYVKHRRKSTLG